MKSVTDAATVLTTSSVSFGVFFGFINQGLAFLSLLIGIVLGSARLWDWWEERKKKADIKLEEIAEATGSSEMDDLFYLE